MSKRAEIAARLAKATPGQWIVDPGGGGVIRGGEPVEFVRGTSITQVALAIGLNEKVTGTQEANADFIANASADIRYLQTMLDRTVVLLSEEYERCVHFGLTHQNWTKHVCAFLDEVSK